MQSALRLLYPAQCLMCEERTAIEFALCGTCWAETPFITGLSCDQCGAALPGEADGASVLCDDCLTIARPWERGRAALSYRDLGRRIVLALKHGDRTDLARPAATWMAGAAGPLLREESVIVPVPLHWTRLVKRRYNQAALLANALGRETGRRVIPDLLARRLRTQPLGGKSRDARFAALAEAIVPRGRGRLDGEPVLLVDDVMTSGATLAAAAEAAGTAGAGSIDVLTLARAEKDP
ncbi:double zinc ribbon domain-containing protein [Histidinibacterium aquaticum]|uniref:ComF family protein n=1 Tax=Histidinibacterium aquaticum TaxID=2613962 RepID=A0A5J5GGN8_9RHOB|nr:double zinc ribbon domain-containing protein [Histidinibacterium aquaticum]KAA9006903.1 ComF family protein [Histidinibacterium aquaticum]